MELFLKANGARSSTYGPTKTHEESYINANKIYKELFIESQKIVEEINRIPQLLEKMGSPQIID